MKKKILIVMVLFFGLLLTGCNKKETSNIIVEKNTIKVELDLNSESGYSWSYIVNNQDIVSISKTYVGDCSNNVDNCDGKDIYEVKGLKEGTAVVTFDYVNENDEVENEAIYVFVVDENLNVSENHYGSYFE